MCVCAQGSYGSGESRSELPTNLKDDSSIPSFYSLQVEASLGRILRAAPDASV